MKRWMNWTGVGLACAGCAFAGAVGGAMFGMWMTFKVYGGPAEHLAPAAGARYYGSRGLAGLRARTIQSEPPKARRIEGVGRLSQACLTGLAA